MHTLFKKFYKSPDYFPYSQSSWVPWRLDIRPFGPTYHYRNIIWIELSSTQELSLHEAINFKEKEISLLY